MKNILSIVAAALLVISLWAIPSCAQDLQALKSLAEGAWKGESLGKLVLPLLLGEVGLTPEQKQQVKEIVAAHREPLQVLFRELKAVNVDLAEQLLVAEQIEVEDMAPQVQRITQLREQLLWEGLKAVLEVRAVLTPEQRAKAAGLKAQIQSFRETMKSVLPKRDDQTATEKNEAVDNQ